MQSVVGIFSSRISAEEAYKGLRAAGIPADSIIFLTRGDVDSKLQTVPTTDAEGPGMGKTLGAYVGAVIGASGGLMLGTTVASLTVPGVGPILAAGFGAAAALGLGGAAAGATAGESSEKALDQGVPRDEVLWFRELLKRDRSVVIANVDSDELAIAAKAVLDRHGAENADEARKQWQRNRPSQAA